MILVFLSALVTLLVMLEALTFGEHQVSFMLFSLAVTLIAVVRAEVKELQRRLVQ